MRHPRRYALRDGPALSAHRKTPVPRFAGGSTVSLWKATDLTSLGSVSTGASTNPRGACSDGVNFWITMFGVDQLARF